MQLWGRENVHPFFADLSHLLTAAGSFTASRNAYDNEHDPGQDDLKVCGDRLRGSRPLRLRELLCQPAAFLGISLKIGSSLSIYGRQIPQIRFLL